MSRRAAVIPTADARPPEAVLEAARALGRLMAHRLLAARADAPHPRAGAIQDR